MEDGMVARGCRELDIVLQGVRSAAVAHIRACVGAACFTGVYMNKISKQGYNKNKH